MEHVFWSSHETVTVIENVWCLTGLSREHCQCTTSGAGQAFGNRGSDREALRTTHLLYLNNTV